MMVGHDAGSTDATTGKAMQFNCVVETNAGAIRLWESEGFDTVGVLPRIFQHPDAGFVDARVMVKWL